MLIQDRVAQTFWGDIDANVQFRAGHTYAGNPVACAVGLAAVGEFLDRNLVENTRRMGDRLRQGIQALGEKHACIVEVRGEGLLLAVEFAQDRATREPFPEALKFGEAAGSTKRRVPGGCSSAKGQTSSCWRRRW